MSTGPDPERDGAGQAKLIASVLAATMLLWMGAQWLGAEMGLATRWVFLFDFAALGAFLWALIVTYQLWRRRRDE
jgi:hypothetical protein